MRCAASSTLFPYTTLFRSVTIVKRQKADWDHIVANMYERWGVSAPEEAQTIAGYLADQFGRSSALLPAQTRDRKSTRLNSSHVESSYAAFRSKKKNTKRHP